MHGSASFWSVLQWKRNRELPRFADPAYLPLGFRHFIGGLGPSPEQQFSLDGDPFDPTIQSMWRRADELMRKLDQVVFSEPKPDTPELGLEGPFNRRLPSGYTYLLQLAAHDMVHSTTIVSRNEGQAAGLANARRLPLRLETVYGGGPTECPHAYQPNAAGFRNRLRLGRIRENGGPVNHICPHLDIARARATDAFDRPDRYYPEALIGDPRNDSHAILSQLVVLAHIIHNALVAYLEKILPPTYDKFADAQRVFLTAQSLFVLWYRDFLRREVLKRILDPAVHQAYELGLVPVLNTASGLDHGHWQAPLEFTYGFFRFAHSMIRQRYTFNSRNLVSFDLEPILKHNSELNPEEMPFERQWTIEWEHFFSEALNPENNFSIRIGPWDRQPFGSGFGDPNMPSGKLMYRDLISSIATRPWSIDGLVRQIRPTHGELLNRSPLFRLSGYPADERPWKYCIAAWLEHRRIAGNLGDADIKTLSSDPPIPFFVRYEAYHDARGMHLGVLGSIVVADVFYGIFRQDKVMGIESTGTLRSQLSGLSKVLFGNGNTFEELSDLLEPDRLHAFIDTLNSIRGNATATPQSDH